MTGLVRKLRDKLDPKCVITGRLRDSGCSVSLTGVPNSRIIVDFQKPGAPTLTDGKRCDYLVVVERPKKKPFVALLELKSGALDASEVVGQLNASAKAIAQLISRKEAITFRAVAYTTERRTDQMNKLREKRNKIFLHDKKKGEFVMTKNCGDKLKNIPGY